METSIANTASTNWSTSAAMFSLVATAVSLIALLALHVVSSEFAPSWRMVSEYANGDWSWLLVIVFFGWAAGSIALAVAIWPVSTSTLGKIGLGLLIVAAVGQVMGGVFDINHPLHRPAALIGIPTLCAAAVLLNIALARTPGLAVPPTLISHLPWVAFALMLIAFLHLMNSLSAAGVDLSAQKGPLSELPAGVSGYVGWANRLLFLACYLWTAMAALAVVRASH